MNLPRETIEFFADEAPVPQPRQRHAVVNGIAQNYLPKNHPVHVFKQVVRLRCRAEFGDKPLQEPLRVWLTFLLPRPKRLQWKSKPMERMFAVGKPDLDNLAKAVMDALNGLLWHDDSQVVVLIAQKVYCGGNDRPGVEVKVDFGVRVEMEAV